MTNRQKKKGIQRKMRGTKKKLKYQSLNFIYRLNGTSGKNHKWNDIAEDIHSSKLTQFTVFFFFKRKTHSENSKQSGIEEKATENITMFQQNFLLATF